MSILTGRPARSPTTSPPAHPRRGFIPVLEDGTGWLLFLYDPVRDIIEVQRRGKKQIIDLTQYKEGNESEVRE